MTMPFAGVLGPNAPKFNARVGQLGSGESNIAIGKLLVSPPSENQTVCGNCGSASVRSTAYNGTALRRTGKERLIRVATMIGKSLIGGNGTRSGKVVASLRELLTIHSTTCSGKKRLSSAGLK